MSAIRHHHWDIRIIFIEMDNPLASSEIVRMFELGENIDDVRVVIAQHFPDHILKVWNTIGWQDTEIPGAWDETAAKIETAKIHGGHPEIILSVSKIGRNWSLFVLYLIAGFVVVQLITHLILGYLSLLVEFNYLDIDEQIW